MGGWSLQAQLDSWQRLQAQWKSQWPPWHFQWKWPWQDREREARRIREECERRREQIEHLCKTVKVDNFSELQELLGAMVLSECVYKEPDHDLVRAVNKFKADFGGQLVPVDRIQASLDHVAHRYLLAEGHDTLFASFIGTNHYKDVIADVNLLQGALFHEEELSEPALEDEVKEAEFAAVKGLGKNSQLRKLKQRGGPTPAAHRGFLGRAKGIPAAEIYQLAQQKNKKLVLCGHSLGGAVAVLTTLAILRVFGDSKPNVKCITFSQPPVGNRALRDYVHRSGWHQHFQTYCIPEDLVPRLLSPAYFQHYGQGQSPIKATISQGASPDKREMTKGSRNGNERMALGLGPLQTSFWRLSKLVPLVGSQNPLQWLKGKRPVEIASSSGDEKNPDLVEPLEIQENLEGVSLVPLTPPDDAAPSDAKKPPTSSWRKRMLPLPSYIPFGQLFLLEKTSVEPLSASEYTRLTSVHSVLMELRDRFQSHTMKSYRSRFQRIYECCLGPEAPSPVFLLEHLPHLPHLRQWLGVDATRMVEASDISEPLSIKAATSLVPLGWSGKPGGKGCEPFKVDVHGFGLHLCTLVRAKVNGRWCSTKIEVLPDSVTPPLSLQEQKQCLQRLRVCIGPPLPASAPVNLDGSLLESFTAANVSVEGVEGLNQVTIYCSSDFKTSSKTVEMRLRRVRLLGLEGAGKTSLFCALMGQAPVLSDGVFPDTEWREGVSRGVNYVDAAGVNLQDLAYEVEQLRQELLDEKKLDMVLLVHNLAHKVPRSRQATTAGRQSLPALAPLLDEVAAAGVPMALALTNMFAVSAERRQLASMAVMEAYKIRADSTVLVNSCPYAVRGKFESGLLQQPKDSMKGGAAQKFISTPISLVQMPFQRKEEVLPVEGVKILRGLVHSVLLSEEEAAFERLAKDAVAKELLNDGMRERNKDKKNMVNKVRLLSHFSSAGNGSSAASVGAAVGAGIGVLVAIVTGAASTLRKP